MKLKQAAMCLYILLLTLLTSFASAKDNETKQKTDLQEYVGSYPSPLFNGNLKVISRENKLMLDVPNKGIIELLPADSDGFWTFMGKPYMRLKFNENENNEIMSLSIFKAHRKLGTAMRSDKD
ncbi:hypothetical protein [Pleionea sp. CnH1-48]|uniref:hypothetical protein n=1 Tax=Pleionea sp. CnH1-48 TaxID=2954494 RepID=UPI0020969F62|nr:hypothetical protein [Pleionea sp. CnH1-48]MCO7222858.1 hypothetical protein [Pleionea sp. CnH1-48]